MGVCVRVCTAEHAMGVCACVCTVEQAQVVSACMCTAEQTRGVSVHSGAGTGCECVHVRVCVAEQAGPTVWRSACACLFQLLSVA